MQCQSNAVGEFGRQRHTTLAASGEYLVTAPFFMKLTCFLGGSSNQWWNMLGQVASCSKSIFAGRLCLIIRRITFHVDRLLATMLMASNMSVVTCSRKESGRVTRWHLFEVDNDTREVALWELQRPRLKKLLRIGIEVTRAQGVGSIELKSSASLTTRSSIW
jgi:hypothetical protein